MKHTKKTGLHLGRPKDRTLRSYRSLVLDRVEALTGQRNHDMMPAEWRADWKESWGQGGEARAQAKQSGVQMTTQSKQYHTADRTVFSAGRSLLTASGRGQDEMKTCKLENSTKPLSSPRISKKRSHSKSTWVEGTVDRTAEHFKLLCGDSHRLFNENKRVVNIDEISVENGFPVVALVGRGRGKTYIVQFVLPENPQTEEILQRARHDLDYYLVDLNPGENMPWDYAIYHANAFANFHAQIHWQYCPKNSAACTTGGDKMEEVIECVKLGKDVELNWIAEQDSAVLGFNCWDPTGWERRGFERKWGDAAVANEYSEVLRNVDRYGIIYLILCPTFLRRPLQIRTEDPRASASY